MKTNIFAPMKKNLTIPAASVKIAGLDGQGLEAQAHVTFAKVTRQAAPAVRLMGEDSVLPMCLSCSPRGW